MKKILLSLLYSIAIVGIGFIVYLEISSRIDHALYEYKLSIYSHEIDALFPPKTLKSLRVKYTYKSGERGSIYYATVDTLSNIAVIECTNFKGVSLKYIQPNRVEKIDVSQNKTYTTIEYDPFPLVEQVLNPRESTYLNITFKKPYSVEREIKNNSYLYLKGSFRDVVFGNTQNCSIVSFRNSDHNEILILKHNGKLYFIVQTAIDKSLLDVVNPVILEVDK